MADFHPGLILIVTGLLALILPEQIRKWAAAAGPFVALAVMIGLDGDASLTYRLYPVHHHGSIARRYPGLGVWDDILRHRLYCGHLLLTQKDGREKCASLIYAGSSIAVVFAGDWISLICFLGSHGCFFHLFGVGWQNPQGEKSLLPLVWPCISLAAICSSAAPSQSVYRTVGR